MESLTASTYTSCLDDGGETCTTYYSSLSTATVSSVFGAAVIQVRWASSDLEFLETLPLSPGVKPTSTSTSPVISASTLRADSTSSYQKTPASSSQDPIVSNDAPTRLHASSSGLSTGVLACIAIGVILFIILLAGVVAYATARRTNSSDRVKSEIRQPDSTILPVSRAKTTQHPTSSKIKPKHLAIVPHSGSSKQRQGSSPTLFSPYLDSSGSSQYSTPVSPGVKDEARWVHERRDRLRR